MLMYNLLEYSDNCSITSGSLWNYYRDEINDDENKNDANENIVNSNKTTTSQSFKYKTKIIEGTPDNGNTLNVEVVVPLKYLSNFCRSFDLALINCELDLACSRYCVISEISRTFRTVPNTYPVCYQVTLQTNSATFQINNTKVYVPVVTLSINDNIKVLENIKQGFQTTIFWNKYRSEITTRLKNNNLDYLIDPAFRKINRLFVLSVKNVNMRDSFHKYYMPLVEIKDFNALIDKKTFFDQPVKNKQEAYENILKCQEMMTKQQEISYHHKYYKTYWYRFIKTNKYGYSSTN